MDSGAVNDYGRALSIDAEAVGQPGQRRFRLIVRAGDRGASVWMEKEQLANVGAWFDEVIEKLDKDRPTSEPNVEPLPPPADYELDFRVRQLALGYVDEEDAFAIQAFDLDAGQGTRPFFRCLLTRGQCRVLSRKIERVVAGGRPICPLCQTPIDPEGHVCPRSNGHHAGATA